MRSIVIRIPKAVTIQRNAMVILCGVFYIMKMLRSFSGSTVAGGIWNYIQIFFVVAGFVIIIKNNVKLVSNKLFLSLFLYTISAMLNGIFFIEFSKNRLFSYLMIAYPVCLLAVIIKDSCTRRIESNSIIKLTFYVISGIFIVSMLRGGIYSTSTGAVADVYYILGLLPLMTVYTKKYQAIPFVVCGMAILLSGKRAGIVLFVAMLILYYFLDSLRTREWKKVFSLFLKLIVILSAFLVLFNLVNDNFNSNLLHRIQMMVFENDSSGRDVLRSKIIKEMGTSNLLQWIFGHGDGAAVAAIGANVHNDFLEVLYNFGIFPCVSYVFFYINCILEILYMIRAKYVYASSFAISIVCSLGLSMFSFYVIDPTYITCGMLSVGYLLIDFKKKYNTNSKMLRIC